MTGADLQWSEIDVGVLGLNERVDPRVLPPGQLQSLVNCEFSSADGSVHKRPGTTQTSVSPINSINFELGMQKLVTHAPQNQLLGVDLIGDAFTSPSIYSVPDALAVGSGATRPIFCGSALPYLTRRQPITSDLQSSIICDSAYVATTTAYGFRVYGLLFQEGNQIRVRVDQVVKGDVNDRGVTVYENTVTSGSASPLFWVRCAAHSDRYVAVVFGYINGDIKGVVVDCSPTPPLTLTPTITGIQTVVTAKATPGGYSEIHYFDLCEVTDATVGWLLTYRSTADAVRVRRINSTLGGVWDAVVKAAADPCGLSVYENGGTYWSNFWDPNSGGVGVPGWRFAAGDSLTGSLVLAHTEWCNSTDAGASLSGSYRVSAICRDSAGTGVMLFHSMQRSGFSTHMPNTADTTRWRSANTSGVVGSLSQKFGIRLWSKPWIDRMEDKYLAWCGTVSNLRWDAPVSASATQGGVGDLAFTGVLMRFTRANSPIESRRCTAHMVGTTGGLTLSQAYNFSGTTGTLIPNAPPPQSISHPTSLITQSGVEPQGRCCALNYRFLPTETRSVPWDMTVRDNADNLFLDSYGRYQSVGFGGSTYMSGGMLTQWDGNVALENGFIKGPWIGAKMTTGGAAWATNYKKWAEQHLFLQAVWETVLSNGEIVRSATSEVLDIQLNGSFDVTPPDCSIDVFVEPHTLTARAAGLAATGNDEKPPRTIVTLYGSSEPNGQVLHKFFRFDTQAVVGSDLWANFVSSVDATDPIQFTINGTNAPYGASAPNSDGLIADLDRNEVIYNDGGELDNDLPWGGCTSLTVHKDRLWVSGSGDDPETVWYSKERVDGRPAEFSAGQTVKVPGVKVHAIASLDDALCVFCEEGIFAIYGDGPNATGDPGSGSFSVIPVPNSVGCASPIVCVTPQGIFFQSRSRLAFLDRARAVHMVDEVQTTTAGPINVLIGSFVPPTSPQARLIYSFAEGQSYMPVYDWDAQKWSLWRHQYGGFPVLDAKHLNGYVYLLSSNGRVHTEFSNIGGDSGTAFRQSIQWGWLSAARPQGYKRWHKMGILGQPATWADFSAAPNTFPFGLKLTLDYGYAESGFASGEIRWSSYELGQTLPKDGINLLRMHISKKTPAVRVALVEEGPILQIEGDDTSSLISTSGATTLRVKIQQSASFTNLTVTSGLLRSKSQVAADLTTAIAAQGWADYLRVYVGSSNKLVLETTKEASDVGLGSYLAVDSVANGSTLNSRVGFNTAGEVGIPTVPVINQAGFKLQGLNFEVGQARGAVRLPPNQSR